MIVPCKVLVRRRSSTKTLQLHWLDMTLLLILLIYNLQLIHINLYFVHGYTTFSSTCKASFVVQTSLNHQRHSQSVPVVMHTSGSHHVVTMYQKMHLPYISKNRNIMTMISSSSSSSSSSVDETETRNNNNNNNSTDKMNDDAFFITNHNETNDQSLRVESTHDEKVSTSTATTTTPNTSTSLSPQPPKLKQPPPPSQQQQQKELVENLSKAAWQMGSDFFVALRWGAANALTASLPNNQRQILLDRLDTTNISPSALEEDIEQVEEGDNVSEITKSVSKVKDSEMDDGYERVTNSVNEAVVASIVTKTQRDEQKWNKEKEIILQQAEIAVQKRVETELAIQQQRYEEEIQRLAALEKSNNSERDDDDNDDDDDSDDDTITPVRHPVLGPVLYDFGYKRLHLVSADILATIPVWKKQRTYRHERAKSMSIDKMKTLHLGFPGVICIHEERSTGKIAIIDGQHRVGMMKILQDKQKQIMSEIDNESNTVTTTGLSLIDLDHVLVEVYTETEPYSTGKISSSSTTNTVSSIADHAQELFTEINKAEPVKLVDMPGVATGKERKIISQACSKLEEQYTIMFRPSQKCRPPNVNIDNLRDTIFASNILKRHTIQSSTQLYDWLIQQNQVMGEKYTTDTKLQSSLNDKVWNKAQTNQFYLGLDSSWLYN